MCDRLRRRTRNPSLCASKPVPEATPRTDPLATTGAAGTARRVFCGRAHLWPLVPDRRRQSGEAIQVGARGSDVTL
jgi:hypothetical protein